MRSSRISHFAVFCSLALLLFLPTQSYSDDVSDWMDMVVSYGEDVIKLRTQFFFEEDQLVSAVTDDGRSIHFTDSAAVFDDTNETWYVTALEPYDENEPYLMLWNALVDPLGTLPDLLKGFIKYAINVNGELMYLCQISAPVGFGCTGTISYVWWNMPGTLQGEIDGEEVTLHFALHVGRPSDLSHGRNWVIILANRNDTNDLQQKYGISFFKVTAKVFDFFYSYFPRFAYNDDYEYYEVTQDFVRSTISESQSYTPPNPVDVRVEAYKSGLFGNTLLGTFTTQDMTDPPPENLQITSGPTVEYLTSTSALIQWTTNLPSTSKIGSGGLHPYIMAQDDEQVYDHSLVVNGLVESSTYPYFAFSQTSHSQVLSAPHSFCLLDLKEYDPPVITNVRVGGITNFSANILWDTDEPSSSKVYYGPDDTVGHQSNAITMVTAHSLTLTHLAHSSTYYFCVESSDRFGNTVDTCFAPSQFDTRDTTSLTSFEPPVNILDCHETLSPGGDIDIHQISIQEPGFLHISYDSIPGDYVTKYQYVAIYDHCDTLIETIGTNAGYSTGTTLYIDAAEIGTYKLQIYWDNCSYCSSDNPYNLVVDHTPIADAYFFELNNASDNAASVSLNEQTEAYLLAYDNSGYSHFGGDVDWYQVSVTEPGFLDMSYDSISGDYVTKYQHVSIYDPNDTFIETKAASAGNSTSTRLYIDAGEVGIYKFRVHWDNCSYCWSSNEYQLSNYHTSLTDIYSLEPNETSEQAVAASLNEQTEAYLLAYDNSGYSHFGGDVDWYQVSVTEPGFLDMSYDSISGDYVTKYQHVSIYDPNDTFIETKAASAGNSTSTRLYIDAGEVGIYKFRVHWDDCSYCWSTNTYRLSSQLIPVYTDSSEPDDSIDAASLIRPNGEIQGQLLSTQNAGFTHFGGDVDWYQVDLPKPGSLFVDYESVYDFNTKYQHVSIYDSEDILVETLSASAGNSFHRTISIDTSETGTFKLRVNWDDCSYCWSENPYTLTLNYVPSCYDNDEDGYESASCGGTDCDDGNPNVNPGSDEVCDGADNNCWAGVDEQPVSSYSCTNGIFCDGEEICSEESQCIPGPDPCPDDGLWCNGTEGCDEPTDSCTHSGDPCIPDENECTLEQCDDDLDMCESVCDARNFADSCCEDDTCQGELVCKPKLPCIPLLLLDEEEDHTGE